MNRVLKSTSPAGIDRSSLPMRLFQKAKRHGVWDPCSFDFARDRADWLRLDSTEREVLLHLTSLFQAGEESVTLDLLPLIQALAAEGRLEEEIYLTSFLWEEAKHVELFRRFLDEVADEHGDLARFASPCYRELVYGELPAALDRLRNDPSPLAQAEASVTYNMIVEGVLAETGYQGYFTALERRGLMPGMRQAIALLKRDESRHIAFGVYLLARLVAEHGEPVWSAVERRMDRLLPLALGTVEEIFAPYDPMPFDLARDEFVDFAVTQFQYRYQRIALGRESGGLSAEATDELVGDEPVAG